MSALCITCGRTGASDAPVILSRSGSVYRAVIVSHRHRFIFLAVPRTGSQSVRAALRTHLGADDWEQSAWKSDRRLPVPALASIGHGHIDAVRAQAALDPAIWQRYFKFAFVRNPWDRFISAAFARNARRPLFLANPAGYLKLLLCSPRVREDPLFRPQLAFLTDDSGGCAADFVGRFETFQRDFDVVCQRLGLAPTLLPRLHASAHDPAAPYYDSALQAQVADFYRQDIECFGYSFTKPDET
jgi:hypothetical protein